jgi:hypothetical protein
MNGEHMTDVHSGRSTSPPRGWVPLLGVLLVLAGCGPEKPAAQQPSRQQPAGQNAPTRTESPLATVVPIHAFLTGYTWFDNTPPGSVRISHPVLHTTAGGTGTFEDPITVAVGHTLNGGTDILDWPTGTKFYVPNLRRYLIVEDTCGDGDSPPDGPCHTGYPDSASTWLDMWIGGAGGTQRGSNRCADQITGTWDVVVDALDGYAVHPGDVYTADGCTQQYGNTLVVAD